MNPLSDNALIETFRRENSDQFNTLVRMHLSFVLDRNTDDSESFIETGRLKKWTFAPFIKKVKYSKGIMDGVPLTQEGICQVYQLIEHLSKEQNIKVEGIFRRTGSLNRQQELKNLLNQGLTLNLEGGQFSVHDCASVLKGFLAELPEPLLSDAHYPIYCQISETYDVQKKPSADLLHALQLLLLLLPPENRSLLVDVLNLLHTTASHENCNKMSADNLATLFTPHLLCPRTLSAENLHGDAHTLSKILSFMIAHAPFVFHVPPKLAVDIRAYREKESRKQLHSPRKLVDESVGDNFAANTVYSFVDHERTAKENQSNPTETALAQLYAHIQSLPESAKKRKLVKQFNKENGHGTPLQVMRATMAKNRSTLGESIKRHIFSRGIVKPLRNGLRHARSTDDQLGSPATVRSKLLCTNCDASSPETTMAATRTPHATIRRSISADAITDDDDVRGDSLRKHNSASDLHATTPNYLTSTPAITHLTCAGPMFTPTSGARNSMSPITRSTQRMSKAMQETMMTPRSRKPVLLVSGTNINHLHRLHFSDENLTLSDEERSSMMRTKSEGDVMDAIEEEKFNALSVTFKEYLSNRSIVSLTDHSFSSRTDDYASDLMMDLSEDKLSESLLHCLNGFTPEQEEEEEEKELILKPKQFDENGKPIVYETSF